MLPLINIEEFSDFVINFWFYCIVIKECFFCCFYFVELTELIFMTCYLVNSCTCSICVEEEGIFSIWVYRGQYSNTYLIGTVV